MLAFYSNYILPLQFSDRSWFELIFALLGFPIYSVFSRIFWKIHFSALRSRLRTPQQLWEKRNRKSRQDLDLQTMAQRQNMSALQLEDLPDEMLEKVFSYMKIGDLIHCGHVSQRLRNVWNIESLWQSVDLSPDLDNGNGSGSKVQTDFIIFLLEKGCQYLNLRVVELTGI